VILACKEIDQYILAEILTYFGVEQGNTNNGGNVNFNTPKSVVGKKEPHILPYSGIKNMRLKLDSVIDRSKNQEKQNDNDDIDNRFVDQFFGKALLKKQFVEVQNFDDSYTQPKDGGRYGGYKKCSIEMVGVSG